MIWNREYKGISISFEDRIVRIKSDSVLMEYLAREGNDAVILSGYILGTYYDMYHKPLEITQHSLAVEILIHAYLDKFLRMIERKEIVDVFGSKEILLKLVHSLEEHTEIIDCGEREVDNNRIVFDMLEKVHPLIYKMLGDQA